MHTLVANDRTNVSKKSPKNTVTPRFQTLKPPELSCMAQSLILFGPNHEFLLCWVLTPTSLTKHPSKTDVSDIVHEKTTVFLCNSLSNTLRL